MPKIRFCLSPIEQNLYFVQLEVYHKKIRKTSLRFKDTLGVGLLHLERPTNKGCCRFRIRSKADVRKPAPTFCL